MSTTAASRVTTAGIRQDFVDFFAERHGHVFVPSSPVVPHDDPTLLFTNAGMNQFKDVFLGRGRRDYRRAVNSQKCIRAGGKHNDLEDVGRDLYHHTFFEMLGNWSFGDYFKVEAIAWAWELLTDVWGLDPDRLHVTVFEGSEEDGTPPDEDAEAEWLRYVPAERIGRFGKKDNFWEMGASGPCGPCSEIHYDGRDDEQRAAQPGRDLVNADHPDVIEIWNLVFMEFNRSEDGRLVGLPARHVDTGMGLERVARVLQGVQSNYDIDVWTPIFEDIRDRGGVRAYAGKLEDPIDVAYRIIADHVRCLTIALTDGARPSNDGRGYVLRRILRRAVRVARQSLGVEGPLLTDLVPAVVDSLGDAFPELKRQPGHVADVIRDEEESFLRTLDRGLELFDEAADEARATGDAPRITAEQAFRLHDTYGFPIDLTRMMAGERGLGVDEAGYESMMEEARERSRRGGSSDRAWALPPEIAAELESTGVGPTIDDARDAGRSVRAKVAAIFDGRGLVDSIDGEDEIAIVLDRTCFYAEAGGQVGDEGELRADDHGESVVVRVRDTVRSGDHVLHVGELTSGRLTTGTRVSTIIDRDRRDRIRSNHTATHLLNLALRDVLGDDVEQKGSLVDGSRLRFDFSHAHAMTESEIASVEHRVNEAIRENLLVDAGIAPLEEARSINGVRAVFGEKYPDPVRVVSIGATIDELLADPASERWAGLSIEFCGGTHLQATGAAQQFAILGEGALAAGVRRVTALTGTAAAAADAAGRSILARAETLRALEGVALVDMHDEIARTYEELTIRAVHKMEVARVLEEVRDRVRSARKAGQANARQAAIDQAAVLGSDPEREVIVGRLDAADDESLRSAMDSIRSKCPDSAVMLLAVDEDEGKVLIVASVPESLIRRGLEAGDWVKVAASACGGGGGGRPDMARAGGKDPGRVDEAIEAAKARAEEALS